MRRSVLKKIKQKLFFKIKHEWFFKLKLILHPKRPLLVMTPTHGNIGDHAIVFAEHELLKSAGVHAIEITCGELSILESNGKLSVLNGRTILVNGGGFLGTIWPESEYMLRQIIINCPKSRIICMPNTMYYENDDAGKKELEASQIIYNGHKNLKLYAREKISYESMKDAYNNVELCPDVVFSLNVKKSEKKRSGCTLFLRRDKEKTLNSNETAAIIKAVEQLFGENYLLSDTVKDRVISKKERKAALDSMLEEFKSSELAVTDRMHGMVFAAITETPCIVIGSKSHKLQGSYEWIKDLPYITFCDSVDDIFDAYQKVSCVVCDYSSTNMKEKYNGLIEDIKMLCKKR